MKTILSETYFSDILQMKSALSSTKLESTFVSYRSYFQETTQNDLSLLLPFHQTLLLQKDSFPIYGNMFQYPAFCNEILSFAKMCSLYDISSHDLPSSTSSEKELQRILEIALKLPFPQKKEPIDPSNDMVLTPYFANDVYHYGLYSSLRQKHPMYLEAKQPTSRSFHHSLNTRKEIESIAQDICNHQDYTNIILCDPSNQLPVIQTIFDRYHIPYTCVINSTLPRMYRIFTSLLRASLEKDSDSLCKAITTNAFPIFLDSAYFEQLESILTTNSQPESICPHIKGIEGLDNYTKLYTSLDNSITHYFSKLNVYLNSLYEECSYKEKISSVFDILRKHPYTKEKQYFIEVLSLRKTLQEILPFIHTKEDTSFLCDYLETITNSSRILYSDKVIITDLKHPVPSSNHSYILGASSTNYPGFKASSGVFDEQYLEKIPNYPKLSSRYEAYMDCLSWVETSGTLVHYSFSTNDYEGRELQPASLFPEHTEAWPLKRLRPYKIEINDISPEIAESLYIENNTVTGSISSIERWFQCPFSWFVSKGLGIRKKEYPELDNALTGTLQHAVLEQAVNTYGKEYASMTHEQIEAFVSPAFEALTHCHPHNKILYTISKQRMLDGLYKALAFLQDYEKHTSYVPYKTEHKFKQPISEHVLLNGIIDRIDIHEPDSIRVIDYKSSPHSISSTKLEQGTCLQLLSYLTIAEELTSLTPAGAFYYSLKEQVFEEAGMIVEGKKNDKEVIYSLDDPETHFQNKKNAQRLEGWKFTDRITELDDDGSHIKFNKQKEQNTDFEYIKQTLKEVYEFFFVNVKNGNIKVEPIEGACTFCDYKSICRFQGEFITPKTIKKRKEEN